MSENDKVLARRRFLGMVGAAGAAGAAMLTAGVATLPGCGGNNGETQNTTPFDAGAVTEFTAPVWKLFAHNTTIVGRDAMGFFAYSSVCTHQACPVAFDTAVDSAGTTSSDGATTCGCHNSRFRSDGSVMQGPARTNLAHFQVTVTAGRVSVNPGSVVAAGTRTTA